MGTVCWDQYRLPTGFGDLHLSKREGVGWRSPRRLDKLRGGNKNIIIAMGAPSVFVLVCMCVCL